jgi:hypothetical protein
MGGEFNEQNGIDVIIETITPLLSIFFNNNPLAISII